MRHHLKQVTLGLAVLTLFAFRTHFAASGNQKAATYKGSKLCKTCHKNEEKSKAIVAAYPHTAHAKAMQEASAKGAVVADLSNAPFPKDKIAYVLGSGRTQQAYLDVNFQLLPAQWNVRKKAWEPVQPVDAKAQCLGCHTTGFDAEKGAFAEMGVGCEMCHGPGSVHNKAMLDATEGKEAEVAKQTTINPKNLPPQRQAMVCGQCHSVGKDKAGHPFPAGFRPGDDLTAIFTDAKPTAAGRNQQFSELLQSQKHYEAGTVCENCHDPHGDPKEPRQLRRSINELCMSCHGKDDSKSKIADPAKHSQDNKGKPDAKCSECHMPDGRHIFAKPPKP